MTSPFSCALPETPRAASFCEFSLTAVANTDKLSSCMFVPDGAWLEEIDSTEQKTPNNRDLSHTGLCSQEKLGGGSPGLCDIYMSPGTNSLLLGHSQPVVSITKCNSCVLRGCWSSSHHVCILCDRNGNRKKGKKSAHPSFLHSL